MCEAHAFIIHDGKEEKLLENVDELQVDGDSIRLVNIFGEQKTLQGRIESMNLVNHKIIFEAP